MVRGGLIILQTVHSIVAMHLGRSLETITASALYLGIVTKGTSSASMLVEPMTQLRSLAAFCNGQFVAADPHTLENEGIERSEAHASKPLSLKGP